MVCLRGLHSAIYKSLLNFSIEAQLFSDMVLGKMNGRLTNVAHILKYILFNCLLFKAFHFLAKKLILHHFTNDMSPEDMYFLNASSVFGRNVQADVTPIFHFSTAQTCKAN